MEIDKNTLLMLKSNELGAGEPDLGAKLMNAFLNTLYESGKLPAKISCLNSGIYLTTSGSPVLEILGKYADAGVEIVSCTTCLNYYDRMDKLEVGKASNMKETVADLQSFKIIMTP